MKNADRLNFFHMLIQVAEIHFDDFTDGSAGFFLLAGPRDTPEMTPGLGDLPQEFDQVPGAGPVESQGRLQRTFIVCPALRPFILWNGQVPCKWKQDPIRPDDRSQVELPEIFAFNHMVNDLTDGPATVFTYIQIGITQPGNGGLQTARQL